MWESLLQAIGLLLVIEGIIPFINPAKWRHLVARLGSVDDNQLRTMGICSMFSGVALLYLM